MTAYALTMSRHVTLWFMIIILLNRTEAFLQTHTAAVSAVQAWRNSPGKTLLLPAQRIQSINSINSFSSSSGSKLKTSRTSTSSSSSSSIMRLSAAATNVLAYASKPSPVLALSSHPVMMTKHFLTSASLATISLLSPTVAGGLLSGGLHAISGPDHLAALLPPSVGKPGWYGLKLGATWGLGHALSAMLLGLSAFFLKGRISSQFKFLQKLSAFTEMAVGASLLAIGAVGLKENLDMRREASSDSDTVSGFDGNPVGPDELEMTPQSAQAIFANGVLHGFSWDGAPSLAPALAMTSWRAAVSFLLSYGLGTMAAMSITAGVFGEGSMRLGKVVNNPDLPKNLSLGSSLLAIGIGMYWIFQAVFLK